MHIVKKIMDQKHTAEQALILGVQEKFSRQNAIPTLIAKGLTKEGYPWYGLFDRLPADDINSGMILEKIEIKKLQFSSPGFYREIFSVTREKGETHVFTAKEISKELREELRVHSHQTLKDIGLTDEQIEKNVTDSL
ncbi:MAG TPA: hypothetical protein VNF06_01510 [Candidatus Aquilonibacter sp.]|nr:hypothetical protein [Candidatus Aquilonibacter sp.]